ncbi:2-oxoglutarate dehydrogenase, E2 component, dihydrolipoamide succinyltransferase [Nocardioides sp. zg-1228]|uniref:2-oxoglutarate dehydrogenase, E2 component, dihydrolipoamide succinyltransferase n=1 Tax=Nocardioides sp. zg-1228 TaxID=2763008 RepID=UPI001642ED68|nr:2-oxoglutarate dehydrogenase, E2 component, dihydrolipoamide succinyltransferase [Nocardioides sp. zg-1228]MBC2934312.1 2-oxoglutarate dehydrogenase, E2 component, dihydrolipoamide succinyltransferase [Nocardioides sp. zg-1228]QSF59092.1 2-oxoglutarate dehydrogenase, E2 component, dihydrolipoamide succinyltransferase [Nocardioides sp. zg-1228]
MASEVTLPALGESVTEGTVTRWLKQVGDTVAVDEPLLEVSTDKVDTEIPSPVAGTLLEIKANEDDTVEVGTVLAVVGEEGESAGDASGTAQPEAQPQDDAESEKKAEQEEQVAEETGELPDGDQTPESEKDDAPAQEEPAAEQAASGDSGSGDSSGGGGGGGTPVTLPALGESVTEGTVTRWLKQVGDEVAVDEPLLEVSTDKVDTEIPSPIAGTLLEIKAAEDETVEVGAELAIIGSGDAGSGATSQPQSDQAQSDQAQSDQAQSDQAQSDPAQAEDDAPTEAEQERWTAEEQGEQPQQVEPEAKGEAPYAPAPQGEPEPQRTDAAAQAPSGGSSSSASSSDGGRDQSAYVTPLVRKMAEQHGVDLASVQGTGVGGRIRKQDVLDAAAAAQQAKAPAEAPAAAPAAASAPPAAAAPSSASPSPLRGTTEPLSRLRKVIASRMVESLHEAAQLTQVMEVDVTVIARLRESVKADFLAREGVKLTYLPFFAKAAIDALKLHPKLNAAIDAEKGEVTYYDRENIAFAVDTEKGLLTPVVKEAGDLSIAGLAKKIADVAERTRTNKITPDELSGGTFTITNLGSFGALFDTPIINKPQVAILGPGAVVKRPVVIDDPNLGETIAVRHMVHLSLTYDHRLVDGADAGRFLQEVKKRLEAGQFEV